MASTDTGLELQKDIIRIERNLKQLAAQYSDFLCGASAREPSGLRSQTETLLWKWRGRPIGTTLHQFKIQNLAQRYDVYKEKWDRQRRGLDRTERIV